MNFKEWLILSEALDANTKNLLAKQKAPKDELDAFIKQLEDEPTLIDKPTAFQRFQDKFVTKKDKPKDEDAQRKHFATIPNTTEEELQTYDYYKNENKDSLKKMMEQLRKFIDKKIITLKIENKVPNLYRNTTQGSQKLETPDFGRFTSQLDSIQGSLEQYKGKGNYFNPIEEELNHQQNLVAKGNNIWVFKGHAPDVCRIYGKGHPWCISSSTSAAHWFTYRIQHHQTQYFVFDFNKDEDDPARYVNPGVSPEGMYSEWVDARNTHDTDPEDSESEVGINGYSSINEYKKYLVSKGIPESIWTTTEPEDWEKRLHLFSSYYDENRAFTSAKNDSDPRVFPMYLKIVNRIKDSDFDTLTDEQKKEFLLSKNEITTKQFAYAIKEFKGEYYNSLDLTGKIRFAGKTNDQDKILKLLKNTEISDSNVSDLLVYVTDKDKVAQLIIENKPELTNTNITDLLKHVTGTDKIAELLGKDNINKLYDGHFESLLKHATDKEKIPELIIKYKTELSDSNVSHLLQYATDKEKDKIAELIIEKQPELTDDNVFNLLHYATNKEKIAEILQRETNNINKLSNGNVSAFFRYAADNYNDKIAEIIIRYKTKISDRNISNLLHHVIDKDKMAQLIIEKQPELTDDNVKYLLKDAKYKDKIAESIIEKQPELSDSAVTYLLNHAKEKNKIAELIIKKKPKLSDRNVIDLLIFTDKKQEKIARLIIEKKPEFSVVQFLQYATDRKQMAQIINKYHTKKTPEIQELIDKYI